MSVKNILDDTFPLDPPTGPEYATTYLNYSGAVTRTVASTYAKNGKLCMLFLPRISAIGGGPGGRITITIENQLIPAETKTIYGMRYMYPSAPGIQAAVISLQAGYNTITISALNASALTPGDFPTTLTETTGTYITYLTN